MPDTTESREPMLETARATLASAAELVVLPNPRDQYRAALIADAHVESNLAIAEELRALREHFEGGAIEVVYGGDVSP